jgi:cellulose synthase/poly-beta-1,6-N-acetylglucosamine synthase-like glycosyltransferase
MIILYSIVLVYFGLLYITQIFQLLVFWFDKPERLSPIQDFPMVSVLLAVRNEENSILDCLKALDQLDWPKDRLEVLIGNDASSDQTELLISQFIANRPWFRLFSITDNLGLARGKANVLAQLAHKAKGEVFCITDADIRVTQGWVKGLYAALEPDYGNINGPTLVKGKSRFTAMQSLDWIYAFAQVRVLSVLNIPITAVGNNMLVTKEAYFSTGGYENIPFSITEDFELFKALRQKGWKHKNLFQPEVLAYSEPLLSWDKLFHQRKRWMTGAFQLPLAMVALLILQGMYLPFLIISLFCFPIGMLLWGFKGLLDYGFVKMAERRLNVPGYIKGFLWRELCLPWLIVAQVLYFLYPGTIDWKGRKYTK